MEDHDWQDHDAQALERRFDALLPPPGRTAPPTVVGIDVWRRGASDLVTGHASPANLRRWVRELQQLAVQAPPSLALPCPRVFVSHRRSDAVLATSLAREATRAGFRYWLDVIDLPAARTAQVLRLEQALGRPLTPLEIGVLQAAIIEFALANCTHVLATMTGHTAGSQWVPYEYGRKVDRGGGPPAPAASEPACAWCDTTTLARSALPEYLELAPVHERRAALQGWFAHERAVLGVGPSCGPRPWTGAAVPELPA